MEITTHITAIQDDGKLFAEAAEMGGLDRDVPSCPGWDVRELVRHLGMIHLWAAGHHRKRVLSAHHICGTELQSLSFRHCYLFPLKCYFQRSVTKSLATLCPN